MRKCPGCGNRAALMSDFCSECRRRFRAPEPEPSTHLEAKRAKCSQCGKVGVGDFGHYSYGKPTGSSSSTSSAALTVTTTTTSTYRMEGSDSAFVCDMCVWRGARSYLLGVLALLIVAVLALGNGRRPRGGEFSWEYSLWFVGFGAGLGAVNLFIKAISTSDLRDSAAIDRKKHGPGYHYFTRSERAAMR